MSSVRTKHILIGIVLLAFAVRIPFLHQFRLEGAGRDSAAYLKLADSFSSGEGWVNYSVQFLYALPDSLPHPDSYWSPLFPFMIAMLFSIFGVSFSAAQAVPFTYGIFVPAVIFLLAWELTRSRAAALIAGILAVFHPTLVLWSSHVQPEIVSIFFVTLTLFLVVREETRLKPVWIGISLGLAYLVKYQNGALVIAVVAYYLTHDFRSRGWKQLFIAGFVCIGVLSPWLIRNTVVFGDPFYTAVKSGLISRYPEFGGPSRFVRSFETPPDAAGYIFSHLEETVHVMRSSFYAIVLPFLKNEAGSYLLIPMVLLGLFSVRTTWKKDMPIILFAVFLLVFLSLTMPLIRYVYVLIPVWITLVAVGARCFMDPPPGLRLLTGKPARVVLAAALVLTVAWEITDTLQIMNERDGEWLPGVNYGMLEAGAAAEYIRANTDDNDVVLTAESYHYALVFDRCCVNVPFDDDDGVRYLGEKYGAQYVVMSVRDIRRLLPAWEDKVPEWADLVHVIPPDEIPRPRNHLDYRHVSEVRIYRLKSHH